MRARPLPAFFLLAFALSWLLWSPLLAAHYGWTGAAPPALHLLGSLGPALAALLVTARLGPGARGDLRARLTRWRVGWQPWAFAVGGPLALLAAGLTVHLIVGGAWPGWPALTRVAEYLGLPLAGLILAELVFYGYGEEVGWRGFALPRLEARFGPLWAAVLLALPWALWHLPLLVRNGTYAAMGPALLGGWFLSLLTGSVLMAWLSHLARGSLLVLAVFHGLLDIVMVNEGVSQVALSSMGALVTLWGLAAAWALGHLGRNGRAGRAAQGAQP